MEVIVKDSAQRIARQEKGTTEEKMKKSTLRRIGIISIGSIALTVVTAGAWFTFFFEPTKNKIIASVPPSPGSALKKDQQHATKNQPEQAVPSVPEQNMLLPSVPLEKMSDMSVPHELPPENSLEDTLEETTAKESEQNGPNTKDASTDFSTEDGGSKERSPTGQQKEPSASTTSMTSTLLSDQQPSGQQQPDLTAQGTQGTNPVDIALHPQQHQQETISGPSCTEVSPKLNKFLAGIEEKEYHKETNTTQPLQEHFNSLTTQLLNNPPVVIHETDDLYTLLTNTAHFFRILGKDNMPFLQKVIKQEHGNFEALGAEIYRLTTTGQECVSGKKKLEIPFVSAYEYAGFFLNTLGGRSYLFRRDPGTRLLVNYYAVLLLDQANTRHLNSYGIDIREHLPWLIQEMEANNGLTNKEGYLDKLYALAEKYQALP
ncbi:MAG: hypothetical protein D3916_08820 [Candidatus Electrothrix sp. MAN1_4]|nr:hypothetical protein [Candidatus Electrothrix sp. MAN1_4]